MKQFAAVLNLCIPIYENLIEGSFGGIYVYCFLKSKNYDCRTQSANIFLGISLDDNDLHCKPHSYARKSE